MTSTASKPTNFLHSLRHVITTDMATWVFIGKTFVAAMLALYSAFRLGLDSPATAMTTVFIVAQPQTGLVIAKSFYRVLGTLIGLVMTIVFVAMFAQYHELFLLVIALWVACCVAGAAWFRDFQAYAFLLAGYTSCLIGFPAVMQPEATFQLAVTRVSEILLGILSVTLVSDAIFPQRLSPKLVVTVRGQYARFIQFLSHATAEPLDRTVTDADQLRFVADILTLESLRAASLFEDPHLRIRSDRLRLFNADFMKVSTTLHAVQQLARRLRNTGKTQILAALRPCVAELGPALLVNGQAPSMAIEAQTVVTQLATYRQQLAQQLAEHRAQLSPLLVPEDLLSFECAAELLLQMVDELYDYTMTYASLAEARYQPARPAPELVLFTHPIEAAFAGLRAMLAMLVLCWFWIATAWPEGVIAATIACIGCALFAAAPDPVRSVKQMATGFSLALLAAFVMDFAVLPHMDGFVLLAAGMLPFFLLGMYLATQPKTIGMGAGFNLMLANALPITNVMHFNVITFINNGLAQLLGIGVAGVAFAMLRHRDPAQVRQHLAQRLRHELVRACEAPLQQLPHAFDGRTRDLMRQLMIQPAETCQVLMPCALSVLELGDAIIDLRLLGQEGLPSQLVLALNKNLLQLKQCFHQVNLHTRQQALATLDLELAQFTTLASTHYSPHELAVIARAQRCLYRIYSVLLDEAWFAAFASASSMSKEIQHAA